MINDTQIKNKSVRGAVLGLVFLGILIFGLFLGFIPKKALAVSWSDYYEVKTFSGDPVDNSAILTIQVKTTFSIPFVKRPAQYFCYSGSSNINKNLFTIRDTETGDWSAVIDPYSVKENGVLKYTDTWTCPASVVFSAGYTYDFKLTKNRSTDGSNLLGVCMRSYYDSNPKGYFYLNVGDYVNKLFEVSNIPDLYNYNIYDFLPVPVISITYPQDNYEISEAFYIQGTYDAKGLDLYPNLYIWLQYENNDIYPFVKNFNTITGDLYEKISGLPAGDYNIRFIFAGGLGWFEVPDRIFIKVVENIPYELPITEELPPDFFSPFSPERFYLENSNYATATAFYVSFTGAVEPLISVIGDNLTFFSSQFSQDKAKDTGQKMGQAILLVRTYTGNLNAFFHDLPISEALFLYLLLLVVVAVFRLVRIIIKLLPFT